MCDMYRSIQFKSDLVNENNQKLGRYRKKQTEIRQNLAKRQKFWQNEASFRSFSLQPIKNLVAAKPLLAGAHLIGTFTQLDPELDALNPAIDQQVGLIL